MVRAMMVTILPYIRMQLSFLFTSPVTGERQTHLRGLGQQVFNFRRFTIVRFFILQPTCLCCAMSNNTITWRFAAAASLPFGETAIVEYPSQKLSAESGGGAVAQADRTAVAKANKIRVTVEFRACLLL